MRIGRKILANINIYQHILGSENALPSQEYDSTTAVYTHLLLIPV